jgi:hypothetical protein
MQPVVARPHAWWLRRWLHGNRGSGATAWQLRAPVASEGDGVPPDGHDGHTVAALLGRGAGRRGHCMAPGFQRAPMDGTGYAKARDSS